MNCDILVKESILDQCGMVMDDNNLSDLGEAFFAKETNPEDMVDADREKIQEWLRLLQKSEIEERMSKAIEEENYELAGLYKEEMQRREKEGDNA